MKPFNVGPGVPCDLDKLIDSRLLIQSNSGGGKSYLVRRLLEQTHGQVQQLVIDPEGEFSTLRERFDYVLAARQGGDTAADPRSAKLLAERLLELGVSAILDIYELKAHERIRFVRAFLEALVDAPKRLWHPALVVVDEAHMFCPQVGEAESASAVIDLATRGRKRGYCAVLATQRLSKLHKDAAAECNNKLIGRTSLDVDMKRAGDELGFAGRDQVHQLRTLSPGEFFAFGQALTLTVTRVKVGGIQTTHPKAGARLSAPPPPPPARVKQLLPQLADLPAEAEARTRSLEDLQREVATLKRDLAKARKGVPTEVREKVVEKDRPVLKDSQLNHLQRLVDKVGGLHGDLGQALQTIATAVREVRQPAAVPAHRPTVPVKVPAVPRNRPSVPSLPVRAPAEGFTGPQQRILDALAWLESVGVAAAARPQLAFLAGASPKSSAFANNLGALRSQGWIQYSAAGVGLTDDGRPHANAPDTPLTPEDLQAAVLAKVSGPQGRILRALIPHYPTAIDRTTLANHAEASPTSSAFANNLGFLRSLGFIDYLNGHVMACPVLFLEHG